MPTYEYRCAEGHTFEVFQRMSDEPLSACPDCGAEARRVVSGGGGVLFKGEGFYITDYRSEDYKKRAKAEGGDSGGAGASSGSDSDD
ncbi:MAG: zinc ribbon domain-containing protein [Gemmatimonadetes bacterium]|nr:MAG: zinc ribbon domain-containing protein [Gemmatimonadota bacterium]